MRGPSCPEAKAALNIPRACKGQPDALSARLANAPGERGVEGCLGQVQGQLVTGKPVEGEPCPQPLSTQRAAPGHSSYLLELGRGQRVLDLLCRLRQ